MPAWKYSPNHLKPPAPLDPPPPPPPPRRPSVPWSHTRDSAEVPPAARHKYRQRFSAGSGHQVTGRSGRPVDSDDGAPVDMVSCDRCGRLVDTSTPPYAAMDLPRGELMATADGLRYRIVESDALHAECARRVRVRRARSLKAWKERQASGGLAAGDPAVFPPPPPQAAKPAAAVRAATRACATCRRIFSEGADLGTAADAALPDTYVKGTSADGSDLTLRLVDGYHASHCLRRATTNLGKSVSRHAARLLAARRSASAGKWPPPPPR